MNKSETPCRYWRATGKCMAGDGCLWSHDVDFECRSNDFNSADIMGTNSQDDGYGYQQYSLPNGIPKESKLQQFMPKSQNGSKLIMPPPAAPAAAPLAAPQGVPSSSFANMNLGVNDAYLTPPRAVSGVPGLPHSSSTPSFAAYTGQQQQTVVGTNLRSNAMSAAASPSSSPHLTPRASPTHRKVMRSPVFTGITNHQSSSNTPASTSANLVEEVMGGTTYYNYYQAEEEKQAKLQLQPPPTQHLTTLPANASSFRVSKTRGSPSTAVTAGSSAASNGGAFTLDPDLKRDLEQMSYLMHGQVDPQQFPGLPSEVEHFFDLCPLELEGGRQNQVNTYSYPTSAYKAVNHNNGLTYCLRRVHGYKVLSHKWMVLVDLWKKVKHPNLVSLREVFSTKAFGDISLIFVFDYIPGAETLTSRHFANTAANQNGYDTPSQPSHGYPGYGGGGATSANPGGAAGTTHSPYKGRGSSSQLKGGARTMFSEQLIWNYVIQLTSVLRFVHCKGLAARVLDTTTILINDLSNGPTLYLNSVGIFDVLGFDPNIANPLQQVSQYQQEDLLSLGKLVLALACNSLHAIRPNQVQASMEYVSRTYSGDIKNLLLYLLTSPRRSLNVNDTMPMIGARFYSHIENLSMQRDNLTLELLKMHTNDRLLRLICKLSVINDRPEFNMDPNWSETGDNYLLKLYRSYLFHQQDQNQHPWLDIAHIVQSLKKLDAGVPEKITLMTLDEQSVLIVSYADLKRILSTSFHELKANSTTEAGSGSQQQQQQQQHSYLQ